MRDKLMKLMQEKKAKKLSPIEKNAKMNVLKDIQDMASDEMGSKLKGLKKVSVASDSKEGLQEGLDKAKELLDKNISEQKEDESSEHESMESESEELAEEAMESEEQPEEEMSLEDVEQKIQELMKKKEELKAKA